MHVLSRTCSFAERCISSRSNVYSGTRAARCWGRKECILSWVPCWNETSSITWIACKLWRFKQYVPMFKCKDCSWRWKHGSNAHCVVFLPILRYSSSLWPKNSGGLFITLAHSSERFTKLTTAPSTSSTEARIRFMVSRSLRVIVTSLRESKSTVILKGVPSLILNFPNDQHKL